MTASMFVAWAACIIFMVVLVIIGLGATMLGAWPRTPAPPPDWDWNVMPRPIALDEREDPADAERVGLVLQLVRRASGPASRVRWVRTPDGVRKVRVPR